MRHLWRLRNWPGLALACLILAALGPARACAERVTVDRIDILTFGIYSPGKITKQEDLPGTNGITLREGRELLSQTETVPGVVGTSFGIRFTLVGKPKGKVVKLTYITRFPPGGMVNDKGVRLDKTQFEWTGTIGDTGIRTYTLTNAWEVVPGDWNLEFYYEGRKIGEKRFTVTAP